MPEREQAVVRAAAATEVRGRLQVLAEDPLTILDGAHNPHAVSSLLRSLPELIGERPLALVLGVLEDKDAAAMLELLLARARRAWFVAPPGPRALPPATLSSLARQLGFTAAESGSATAQALGGGAAVGPRARRRGARDGLGVPRRRGARGGAGQVNEQGPSVLRMVGLVAGVVALVILVFFAAGYGFGRLFL